MLRSLYLGLFLAIVAALCAVSIGLISNYATPIIEERQQQRLEETLSEIYPLAASYNDASETHQFSLNKYGLLKAVYTANDENDILATVYKAETKGRNADIVLLIAINNQTKQIDKISYLSHKETPGRGDKIETREYLDKIEGGSIDNEYLDTIADATISSTAVNKAINEALEHFNEIYGG